MSGLFLQIRLPPGHTEAELQSTIARQARRKKQGRVDRWRIVRQSIDARRKPVISIQYTIELNPDDDGPHGLDLVASSGGPPAGARRPVVVGAGPAGLFAALYLARAGWSPLLIERGGPVEERTAAVQQVWSGGPLDPDCNVQFGEGGAGAFSDGKLTSHVKGVLSRAVLEELVMAGAPDEILYLSRPHIGTDRLVDVVRRIRGRILEAGGEISFHTRMTGITQSGGRLTGLQIQQRSGGKTVHRELTADTVILAIGHSARDTYELLSRSGIVLLAKPFAMGVRIEHLRRRIQTIQYGRGASADQLPAADYRLVSHLTGGRTVYTFCMCPGGQVIQAASEPESIVTNGMSLHARADVNSNSALLVSLTPQDFPHAGPLGGMYWQRELEQAAWHAGGGTGRAPVQSVHDFLGDLMPDESHPELAGLAGPRPSFCPGTEPADLAAMMPDWMSRSLREGLLDMNQRMPGFAEAGAVLTGLETRSSAPVRIVRGDDFHSSLQGLIPCGEGAGYAGGILSAAADGLRCAKAIAEAGHQP